MKKDYIAPELELTRFSFKDVLNSGVNESPIIDEGGVGSNGDGGDINESDVTEI